jgi:signal peptidase I
MSIYGLNGVEFQGLTRQILQAGHAVRFQAGGGSMQPGIRDGDILEVAPVRVGQIRRGDVLLFEADGGRVLAHRVLKTGRLQGEVVVLLKGDACPNPDGWFQADHILGRATAVQHGGQRIDLTRPGRRLLAGLGLVLLPWASKFNWLPGPLRRSIKHFLLG